MISNNQNGNHLQQIDSVIFLKENDNLNFRDNIRNINSEVLCFLLAFRIEILEIQLEKIMKDMKISIDLGNKYKCQCQEFKTKNKELLKQIKNQIKEYHTKILNKDKLISELNIKLQNLEIQKQFIQQQYLDDLDSQENWLNQKLQSQENQLQKQIFQYKQQLDQAELDYQIQQKSYEENIQAIIHNHSSERQEQLNNQQILEQQFIQQKSKYLNEINQLNNQIEQQAKRLSTIPLLEQEILKMTRIIKQQEQRLSEFQAYIQKQAFQFQDMLKIKDKDILNSQQRIKNIEVIKTQSDYEKLQLDKDNLILINENKQQLALITSIKDQNTQFKMQLQELDIILENKSNFIEQLELKFKQLEDQNIQILAELINYNKREKQNQKNQQKVYQKFNPLYLIIYQQFSCRIFQRETLKINIKNE